MEEMDDSTLRRASEQPADSTRQSNNFTEDAKLSTGATEPDDVMTESQLTVCSSVTKPGVEGMAGAPSSASFKQHKRLKSTQEIGSCRVVPMNDEHDSEDDVARKQKTSSRFHRSGEIEESTVKPNNGRRVLIAAKLNAVVPLQIGMNLVTPEGHERVLPASNLGSIQGIPILLLRDIFSNFDVCTKFRLQRVSNEWKTELDTLRLKQLVQFVDFTEFLREFDRTKNHQGETGQCRDDKSLIRSWLKADDTLSTRIKLISAKIFSVCNHYTVVKNVSVVIKLDDGFEYDSYNSSLHCNRKMSPVANNLVAKGLPFWRTDLVFIDSVMSHMCLDFCSLSENNWGTITLLRTTIYAGPVCQHAIHPLYIARHEAEINEVRPDAMWKELLDTYGHVSDTEALSLLRHCIVRKREKNVSIFEYCLTEIYDGCNARYFEMRDDLRNCDLASVDMSRLYPSTIYTLIKKYHPFWDGAHYTELEAIHATYCFQCSSLGL